MSNTKNKDKLGKCLKKKKSWFTLVELIVVITILAILWTIAFISFQNYTKNSRDWVRIADINLLKKNLEIFITEKWFYPAPDNGTNITYDGWLAWTQWTVWDNVITNLARINKKPVDPLTGNEYTYSLANNKVEYQIWAIFELGWELSYILPIIQKANAATTKTATAFVTWTYNEKIIKVSTWSTDYILAVPSIINANLDDTDLQDIINKKQLVYNNYSNLPSSYENKWYTMTGWFDFIPGNDIVVYSGSMETLWSSGTVQQDFIANLQSVYQDTIVSSTPIIQEIINATTPEQQQILAWSYIDNHVWGITAENTAIIQQCSLQYIAPTCESGYTYDSSTKLCQKLEQVNQIPTWDCGVSISVYQYLNSGIATPSSEIQLYHYNAWNPWWAIYSKTIFDSNCRIITVANTRAGSWHSASVSIAPWYSITSQISDTSIYSVINTTSIGCPSGYTLSETVCLKTLTTTPTCLNWWTFDSSIDQCKYNQCENIIASQTSPTSLSLVHSPRTKTFTFSWTAWTNNWWSCKLQYYKDWTTWTDISATPYNCDTTLTNQSVTLPWDWWNGVWSSIQIRVIRTSDSVELWTFDQNLTCSAITWSASSTPSIDEDCNWVWDNSSWAWTWVLDSTDYSYYYSWWSSSWCWQDYNTCKTWADWQWYTYISLVHQIVPNDYPIYCCYANATWTKTTLAVFSSWSQYIKSLTSSYY